MITQLQSLIVRLDISPESLLDYYRRTASEIVATSIDGRSVRFPAGILRPFVTHSGVHGTFRLQYDQHGKLQHIERLSQPSAGHGHQY